MVATPEQLRHVLFGPTGVTQTAQPGTIMVVMATVGPKVVEAAAGDLAPETCWRAIRSGAAASFMLEDRGHRMLHPTNEIFGALSIFVKDMDLVTDAAASTGFTPPLAQATGAARWSRKARRWKCAARRAPCGAYLLVFPFRRRVAQ